jgi:hypothetical protein
MKSPFGMAFISFLLLTQSVGQAVTVEDGPIFGSVTDATCAAVRAARVQITGTDTGLVKVVTTDSSGLYSVGPLNPRNYELDIVASGFQRTTVKKMVRTETAVHRASVVEGRQSSKSD